MDQDLTPVRFQRLRQLFDEAQELPAQERTSFLDRECAADPTLRRLVDELLDAGEQDTPAPIAARPMIQDGDMIGPYRIERLLGRGGMGVVYLATRADGAFHKQVALKVMNVGLDAESFRRYFSREREILAMLEHPSIARILDAGACSDGTPYLVMEFVDGKPIDRYCDDQQLAPREIIRLFCQICEAIRHAHRNLVVHRDLKHSNILVTAAGEVKLLDFGVSKVLQNRDSAQTQTMNMGTPRYASPDQLRGAAIATASDIYSLGVILYELLTGCWPYGTTPKTPVEMIETVLHREPVAASELCRRGGKERISRHLRGDLDRILLKAIARDPNERYLSVEDLRQDLVRYLEGKPVLAQKASLHYRLGKFVRRNRTWVAAAALLAFSIAGGVLATWQQARRAEAQRVIAEQARVVAEKERNSAQQSSQAALRERQEAERQRQVSEQLRVEAQSERVRAESRAEDLHSLARSLLFDMHDSIRNLAGTAPARKMALDNSKKYLETLATDSKDNDKVQAELADVYERIGDLQSAIYQQQRKTEEALAAYQKALSIREHLAMKHPGDANRMRAVLQSRAKLGDGYWSAGNFAKAVAVYQETLQAVEKQSGLPPEVKARLQGLTRQRLCNLLPSAGKSTEAIPVCRASIEDLQTVLTAQPANNDIRFELAMAHSVLGNTLRLQGRQAEAVSQLETSLELCEQAYRAEPANALVRITAGGIGIYLAAALQSKKDLAGAAAAYAKSISAMKAAREVDVSDVRLTRNLAFALSRYAQDLASTGKQVDAENAMAESLRFHKELVDRPGAGFVEWNEFADALNKSPFPALRNPALAHQYASRAVAASKEKNPFCLDTLAWSLFRLGRVQEAIDASNKALRLLPPAASTLRAEIQAGLQQFERALAQPTSSR